jgi:NAD(P)-dependent dehydrogenase (short-subunit alcohol dehydrogenase family)
MKENVMPTDFTLNGKTALVTGAAKGNGKAIADYLEKLGARVERTDLSPPPGMRKMDVTDEDSVREVMRAVSETCGGPDILINNAGIINKALIDDIDLSDWRALTEVNVTGAVICAKHAARHMKERKWGRIVNISSVQAYISCETYSAYAASKASLSHLTHLWAKELAPWNITVNALCPSYVDTPMMDNTIATWAERLHCGREEALNRLLEPIPGKRLLRPEEIGYWTAVLCTDMGGGLTGANIGVSCGWLLH